MADDDYECKNCRTGVKCDPHVWSFENRDQGIVICWKCNQPMTSVKKEEMENV